MVGVLRCLIVLLVLILVLFSRHRNELLGHKAQGLASALRISLEILPPRDWLLTEKQERGVCLPAGVS